MTVCKPLLTFFVMNLICLQAFIAALVQLFFAWRVKVLTSNTFAVCVIVFCSIAQLCESKAAVLRFNSCVANRRPSIFFPGGGLGTSIAVGMIPEFTQFQRFQVIVIVWLAFSAVADTLITAALVWHLVTIFALYDTVRRAHGRYSGRTRPEWYSRTTSSIRSSAVSVLTN